jgi:hypothetical protein
MLAHPVKAERMSKTIKNCLQRAEFIAKPPEPRILRA